MLLPIPSNELLKAVEKSSPFNNPKVVLLAICDAPDEIEEVTRVLKIGLFIPFTVQFVDPFTICLLLIYI